MKRFLLISLAASAILLSFPFTTHAEVLIFEDLYPGYETCCNSIPSGYSGFDWTKYAMWTTSEHDPNTGYQYGTLDHVSMFTGNAVDIGMSSSESFDFHGAYITAAWMEGQDVTVEGIRDGESVYSSTIKTSYDQPYWFDFSYTDINELWFRPGDEGTPTLDSGHHIVIDNITLNNSAPPVVPEPVSSTLFLVGAGLLGFRHFRKIG